MKELALELSEDSSYVSQINEQSSLIARTQQIQAGKNIFNQQKETFPRIIYQVVHSTPGRLRVRIPRIKGDRVYSQKLEALATADAKISSIRLKPSAASVTFRYPTKLLPQAESRDYIANLIQLAGNPKVANLTSKAQTQQPKQISYWSTMKFPTLATLLSILRGPLGLSISPIIVGGSIVLATLPIARRAIETIVEQHRINIDFLDLTAIAIVTAQRHFLTSCSMLVLIELGEAIRDRTARSSQAQTLDLLSSLSQVVWVERKSQKQQIPLEEVIQEDIVIVYPGEQIPVDGSILRGEALIDEHKLTGESMPVVRSQGDTVYASTLVREGQLYILAERLGADTRAGQTLKLIQDAPVHDTRIENYAAKIADRAVLPTLLLGGAVFAATGNVARAASVLTIDFATGIRVSVPTTVMAAITAAARNGILLRSGRALEKLACVDAIVFDKTGTLTRGDVAIISVKTVNAAISQKRIIQLAAAAEQRITHPVAEAIVRYANEQEVEILPRGEWQYQVGLGIRAEIDGQQALVGSERYLVREGINLELLNRFHPALKQTGYPTIYIASNGEILGAIQYADPLRTESRQVITTLRRTYSAEIHLLTGDTRQRAQAVAKELGIAKDKIHAEAFPEQKAQIVQRLHAQGKTVAFVGDGLNDSAALAYADVSISFRDGSDVARETADVVLMRNDLRGLVEAIAIARNAQKIINQNAGIVALPNLSGLAIAATVGMNPMTATLINNGSSVIAGMNGLRPVLTGS
jgi:Cu2+-exporting ATPase